jgi:hypothetical protein
MLVVRVKKRKAEAEDVLNKFLKIVLEEDTKEEKEETRADIFVSKLENLETIATGALDILLDRLPRVASLIDGRKTNSSITGDLVLLDGTFCVCSKGLGILVEDGDTVGAFPVNVMFEQLCVDKEFLKEAEAMYSAAVDKMFTALKDSLS